MNSSYAHSHQSIVRILRSVPYLAFAGILLFVPALDSLLSAGEPDKIPQPELDFFEQHIRPLLIEHCYECHGDQDQSGGLRLDSRTAWQAGGDSGALLTAGKPNESRLVEAVRYENLNLQMPPSGKLSAGQIAAIEQWVTLGAPDPRDGPAQADNTDAARESDVEGTAQHKPLKGMSIEEGREFWSFKPLSNPAVPTPRDLARVNTAVDAFVLTQLEAAGIAPAPPADKRTLIRRVTYNLIGLPPTPSEVQEFLADDSDDAFQQVCERLLASPEYGERWGRHWLDVARYADSNGLDENIALGNAWRYRDYVIHAFNDDKPFDRFLIEQLAGDLVDEPTVESLTATGFLVLGAKVLAEPDVEKLMMDTIDEQIDATGKAFLGLTFGCARCHDHKFDPVLQSDYYALAAIFKSTHTFDGNNMGAIKFWNEYQLGSAEELEALKPIEAQIAAKKNAANSFKAQAMSQIAAAAIAAAPKYFGIASLLPPRPTLPEVEPLATRHGLHARILHHARVQLELRRDDPAIAQWHKLLEQQQSAETIEQHFAELLLIAQQPEAKQPEANHAASTSEPSPNSDAEQAPTAVTERAPAPRKNKLISVDAARREIAVHLQKLLPELLTVPVQPEFAFDEETLKAYYALMEEARVVESGAPDPPAVMGVSDGQVRTSLPIHIRGSHRNLGEPVPRGFPVALRTSTVEPIFPRRQSGRMELARWMANSQHPLTARVYVNRIWRWHFGRGLVASTENFGVLGDAPSHPELLDWLARYFIESGWSTKELHRLLLASSVYQMASTNPQSETAEQLDPENRWLWKFRRQRLEAEQLRDAMLAVSGRLDFTAGGKTVPLRNRQFVFNHTSQDYTTYESLRRAVYLPIIRNNIYTLFEQFDFPDPTMPTGSRQQTVVAPQALLMLNDELVMDSADALAARIRRDYSQTNERIEWVYRLALGRAAESAELSRAATFIGRLNTRFAAPGSGQAVLEAADQKAWSLFCQTLLASNEFIEID
ncbi:MAG: PSD1 domain-containing protein [Planctomycetales bacterium]|nr:PSD1 domain-containing protein [Planctomycetales bacterium]